MSSKVETAAELGRLLKRVHALPDKIAEDVWPNGAILHCKKCGKSTEISSQNCSDYLWNGWPVCCGQTMMLEKKP